jgi:predicted transcriptional regulator
MNEYNPDAAKLLLLQPHINISGVAREARIGLATIYRILEGKEPSVRTLVKLSNFFKVQIDYFFDVNLQYMVNPKAS